MLRRGIRALLRSLGWQLVRIQKDARSHEDPFVDQRILLGESVGESVGCVIFDVGANRGQTAVAYRGHFPDAAIFSFEPFPESFAELKRVTANDGKIRPFELALTNYSGTATFFVNSAHYTNSLLPVAPGAAQYDSGGWLDPVKQLDVAAMSIDDFVVREAIDHIDILKIDVQGGELLVLEGVQTMLGRQAISLIFCEVNFAEIYQKQARVTELIEFMTQRGYALYGLYNLHYRGNLPLAWGGAIFISAAMRTKLAQRITDAKSG